MREITNFTIAHPSTGATFSERGVPQVFACAICLIVMLFAATNITSAGSVKMFATWVAITIAFCIIAIVFGVWFYKKESAFEKQAQKDATDEIESIMEDDAVKGATDDVRKWMDECLWDFLSGSRKKDVLGYIGDEIGAPAYILSLEYDDDRQVHGRLYSDAD